MKPPNGPHHLTYKPGIGMDVIVTDAGMDTPFGHFDFYPNPPPGQYIRGNNPPFAVVFDTPTTYYAVYGPDNYSGNYT